MGGFPSFPPTILPRVLALSSPLPSAPFSFAGRHSSAQSEDAMAVVIVDDRDPRIVYSPHWNITDSKGNLLGRAPEYNSTTTRPTAAGDKATFRFVGTAVSVFATISGSDTGVNVSIDGVVTPVPIHSRNQDGVRRHFPVFNSPPLTDGAHELVIAHSGNNPGTFNLDYITFQSSGLPIGETRFIDGDDPSVTYSAGWTTNNTDSFFQQTSRASIVPGSWAAVTFTALTSDQLSLRGPVSNPGGIQASAQVLAAVNSAAPLAIPPPPSSAILPGGETSFNNVLYTTKPLDAGTYTINFTQTTDAPFGIDYFLVGPNLGAASQLRAPVVTSSSATVSPAVSSPPPVAASDALTAPSPSSTPPSGPPIAAIAGGIAGGLVVLLLLALAGFFLWRRQRRREIEREIQTHESSFTPAVTRWAGKAVAYPRDSMATLTDASTFNPYGMGAPGSAPEKSPPPPTRPKSGYLYYPDS
ncbi:hypothetical protein MKEN_00291300 [Mycena kentingensis (nom. inval.)]|nr:hypothetical protein MKEN_00291300 [Mycena kentingensis (nom. inval.)]